MAQNYDLTQTGPELQARVDQVYPNRDAIEQETVTREEQDESLETSLKAYTDTEQARAEEAEAQLQGNIDTEQTRAEAAEGALDTRVTTNEGDIELLQSEYAALTQSDIIVGPLPSTGQPNKIYRVPGSTYYTDYMWANGGWVKLAEYSTLDGYVYKGIATPSGTPVQSAEAVFYFAVQPGTYTNYGGLVVTDTIAILKYNGTNWTKDDVITIDEEPTAGSDNLVTSGAVAASVVYDISAANAVGGQLATYADLAAALNGGANVPVELRKGGMEIKFVQSSDNKYVQYRLMADEWSTTVADWQGVDDEPTSGSDNLVRSGGVEAVNEEILDNVSGIVRGNIFILSGNGPYENIGRYIGNDQPQINADYSYSKQYKVRTGDAITVKAGSGGSMSTSIIAILRNGECIYELNASDYDVDVKTYNYTVPETYDNCFVVFSASIHRPASFEIQYNFTNLTDLKTLIDNVSSESVLTKDNVNYIQDNVGILCNGKLYNPSDVAFTIDDLDNETSIYLKVSREVAGQGYFTLYDENDTRLLDISNFEGIIDVPAGFSYAKSLYGSMYVTCMLRYSNKFLQQQIDGEPVINFHYTGDLSSESYIISNFGQKQFKLYFTPRNIEQNRNPLIYLHKVCIVNNGTETTINGTSDDVAPALVYNEYIGGNHASNSLLIVTLSNHGKTVSDIGSVWTNGSANFVIVGVPDNNTLWLHSENQSTYPAYSFVQSLPSGSTLTHVSGATNTDTFILTSNAALSQWFMAFNPEHVLTHIFADDIEVIRGGDYKVKKSVVVTQIYDVFNPASVVEKYKEQVGTITSSSPNPAVIGLNADKLIRVTSSYRFTSASMWFWGVDIFAYQNIGNIKLGFTQQHPIIGTKHEYIPKTLPIDNVDYRTGPIMQGVATYFTTPYYEVPNLPPDRWLQWNDTIAQHNGYLFDYGQGGNNRSEIPMAFYISNIDKSYPYGFSGSLNAGESKYVVAFRKYKDLSDIDVSGILNYDFLEYNNKGYIYADFNHSGIYNLKIPSGYIGKKINILEKSSNIVCLDALSSYLITVDVSNSNPMYGYIVASVE